MAQIASLIGHGHYQSSATRESSPSKSSCYAIPLMILHSHILMQDHMYYAYGGYITCKARLSGNQLFD